MLKQDVIGGFTDLEIFDVLKARRAKTSLLRNSKLHAKFVLRDKKEFIYGSANITGAGLGFEESNSNIECISPALLATQKDVLKMVSVIHNSVIVDENEIKLLRRELETAQKELEWGPRDPETQKNVLSLEDFLFTEPDVFAKGKTTEELQHDLHVLGLTPKPTQEEVEEAFLGTRVMNWLNKQLIEPAQFGRISELIHTAVFDTEPVKRKNVKELQAILYKWIQKYATEDYEIFVRPGGHSQILRRRAGMICGNCGKSLRISQWHTDGEIRYKSCPKCSTKNGQMHIFHEYPAAYGETTKRSNFSQSYCKVCRGKAAPQNGKKCSDLIKGE